MQQLSLDLQLGPGLRKPLIEWRQGDHWQGHMELGLFSCQPGWWQQIGAAFPLQATASPNGLWLIEASVARRPGTGGLALKAGLFALDPDWVTAPLLNAHVPSALDNSLNLNVDGLPINPAVAPGLQLSWTPGAEGQWGSWQLGGFWLDPVDELAGLFGVNSGLEEVRAVPSCGSGATSACRAGDRPTRRWPTRAARCRACCSWAAWRCFPITLAAAPPRSWAASLRPSFCRWARTTGCDWG